MRWDVIYSVFKAVSALRSGIGPVNALWSSALQVEDNFDHS